MTDNVSIKVLAVAVVGGVCFVASLLVMGLTAERQDRAKEAQEEIARGWGERQTFVGPLLVAETPVIQGAQTHIEKAYVLPKTLRYETTLVPEIRSRGIFRSVVYTSKVKVSGEFSADDMRTLTLSGIRIATLAVVRVHPIQYLLVGSALALFYLLLLSLAEQIGFMLAYLLSTITTAFLITAYSSFVLKSSRRAFPIFALLAVLYAYLYFILGLEDYSLLAGSIFLFLLIATIMYSTRNTEWFTLGKKE